MPFVNYSPQYWQYINLGRKEGINLDCKKEVHQPGTKRVYQPGLQKRSISTWTKNGYQAELQKRRINLDRKGCINLSPLSSIILPLSLSHRLLPGLTCITPPLHSIPQSLIRPGHPPDALSSAAARQNWTGLPQIRCSGAKTELGTRSQVHLV